MQDEVLAGLLRTPKQIAPKFLYDTEGSRLFDSICELPEYYLTRAETSILAHNAASIVERVGQDVSLIELGAGSCRKGELLLGTGNAAAFFPVDICADYLEDAAVRVAEAHPRVSVHGVAMDFLVSLESLEALLPENSARLLLYAGSSIGNFEPGEALRILHQFSRLLRNKDALVIGYDLKKDPSVLQRAYDDFSGVTAAFNLNLLARFNRELGADFNPDAFRHSALYNETLGRVEMHLESLSAQEVRIADQRVPFEPHERIHTESSYKYDTGEFDALAARAGLAPDGIWKDEDGYFAVALYTRRESLNLVKYR